MLARQSNFNVSSDEKLIKLATIVLTKVPLWAKLYFFYHFFTIKNHNYFYVFLGFYAAERILSIKMFKGKRKTAKEWLLYFLLLPLYLEETYFVLNQKAILSHRERIFDQCIYLNLSQHIAGIPLTLIILAWQVKTNFLISNAFLFAIIMTSTVMVLVMICLDLFFQTEDLYMKDMGKSYISTSKVYIETITASLHVISYIFLLQLNSKDYKFLRIYIFFLIFKIILFICQLTRIFRMFTFQSVIRLIPKILLLTLKLLLHLDYDPREILKVCSTSQLKRTFYEYQNLSIWFLLFNKCFLIIFHIFHLKQRFIGISFFNLCGMAISSLSMLIFFKRLYDYCIPNLFWSAFIAINSRQNLIDSADEAAKNLLVRRQKPITTVVIEYPIVDQFDSVFILLCCFELQCVQFYEDHNSCRRFSKKFKYFQSVKICEMTLAQFSAALYKIPLTAILPQIHSLRIYADIQKQEYDLYRILISKDIFVKLTYKSKTQNESAFKQVYSGLVKKIMQTKLSLIAFNKIISYQMPCNPAYIIYDLHEMQIQAKLIEPIPHSQNLNQIEQPPSRQETA